MGMARAPGTVGPGFPMPAQSPLPRTRWVGTAVRTIAIVGLAVSAALAVDYLGPEPTFCGDGGCASVRASAWARPLGVPMPLLGLAYFALVLGLALGARWRALRPLVIAGGLGALGLLVVQGAVLGTWCALCVVTDGSALAIAALVLAAPAGWAPPCRRERWGTVVAAIAAVAAALAAGVFAPVPPPPVPPPVLPAVVAREQRAGEIVIVDFVDFECPHCRRFDQRLTAAIAAVGAPVRMVRVMVPLTRIHPNAMSAARAWVCADAQGKGDAVAHALFTAPPDDLAAAGAERLVLAEGVDAGAYQACLVEPGTDARIDQDLADARAAGVSSLPTVYIGATAFVGALASQAELEAALRAAASAAR
jgi:protein-disulfide isomerase